MPSPAEHGDHRWPRVLLGVISIGIGAALTLRPFSSLEALTIYIAASLIVVGAGDLYIGRGEPNPWPSRLAGGVLILAGLAAVALPDLTVRAVAIVVGAALVIGGLARLFAGLRGPVPGDRFLSILGGPARTVFGILQRGSFETGERLAPSPGPARSRTSFVRDRICFEMSISSTFCLSSS
jgi:uncharacterized membrane protein HdeD (DUF308 family)